MAKTTANIAFENMNYVVVLSGQGTNVETTVRRGHQQERIIEAELVHISDVGRQDLTTAAMAPSKQALTFHTER